jgi:hypothetical protein
VTKNVLQDYGVQPQMKKKDESFVDFMQRTTWFTAMTKALQKHSEFMRPELGDYPNMEYGFPEPPKGTLDIPSELKDSELLPGAGPCAISCYAPLYCDDNVKCHANLYNCPPGADRRSCSDAQEWAASNINTGEKLTIVRSGLDAKTGSTIGTPVFPIEIKPGGAGVWAHWPEAPSDQILVTMVDATGVHCQTKLSVFCRQEDCCHASDYVAMTFDDPNTADEIAQNGSITVYVLNGCGPYNWSVTGTGFSLASAVTSVLSNTLSASGSACGTATVTITDECGTTVTAKIRCTSGSWVLKSGTCGLSGSGTYVSLGAGGACANRRDYTYISANKKQTQRICVFAAGGGDCPTSDDYPERCACQNNNCACYGSSIACVKCIEGAEVPPCECYDDGATWNCQCTESLAYYEWEC